MGVFDKEFHGDIVDSYSAEDSEQVLCKLLISCDVCCAECHVAIEPKAREECYREDDYK